MNEEMKSLVSIIVTTCNQSSYLDKCLASILSQSFEDYELLIMDDQSEDDTPDVVKKWEKRFNISDNYRYIKNEPRLGFQRSLNRGLREAKGKYIARLDDDDTWADNDKLRQQVEFLNSHPEHVLVGTGAISVDENGTELSRSLKIQTDEEIRARLLYDNCFVHSSVVYRKSMAMKFGGYIEPNDPFCNEDHDLWLKLGTVGSMANLPIYGVAYTVRYRGIIHKLKTRLIPVALHLKVIQKFKDKYPHHRQAIIIQLLSLVAVVVNTIADVPPLCYLVRFLRKKCPVMWLPIASVYKFLFRGIPRAISRISGAFSRTGK